MDKYTFETMKYDVMFVGRSFPMPFGGGSVNYVHRLLSNVDGFSYLVLTGNAEPSENVIFDKGYGHRIIRSPFFSHVLKPYSGIWVKRRIYLFVAIVQTIYYILKIKPKLVFLTEFSALSYALLIIHPLCHFKIGIFTYAEEITQIKRQNRQGLLGPLKKVLPKSDIIVSVCDYTSDMICEICDVRDKIVKIIPSIKKSHLGDIKKKKQGTNVDIVLLTVARLEERKGHLDVIRALAKLVEEYPNLTYNIVGSGPYEDVILKEIQKLRLTDQVHLLGKVSDEELVKQYINADIFVMPHKELENGDTEGCPTVFLEAGSYQLPVIGGDAGGVSDAIIHNKTGFVCSHTKQDDLYNYLSRLINDPDLRLRMGEAGRTYSQNFYVESQSNRFKEAVLNIL